MPKGKTEETRNGGKENDEEGNRRDHREQGRRVRIHDAGKHDGLGERERP